MAGRASGPAAGTVLLFGPQALLFDERSFRRLRSSILSSASQYWVLDTIAELPGHWEALCQKFPKLLAVHGAELLRSMDDWFRTGVMGQQGNSHLPNILLSPLVVIAQLTQYAEYLKLCESESQNRQNVYAPSPSDTETLGFCSGILSAIAVSCSTNQAQFAEHGGTAVRLAMIIGAFVDAHDALDGEGESRSLATVWRSHQSALEMTRILQRFPEASCRAYSAP